MLAVLPELHFRLILFSRKSNISMTTEDCPYCTSDYYTEALFECDDTTKGAISPEMACITAGEFQAVRSTYDQYEQGKNAVPMFWCTDSIGNVQNTFACLPSFTLKPCDEYSGTSYCDSINGCTLNIDGTTCDGFEIDPVTFPTTYSWQETRKDGCT